MKSQNSTSEKAQNIRPKAAAAKRMSDLELRDERVIRGGGQPTCYLTYKLDR